VHISLRSITIRVHIKHWPHVTKKSPKRATSYSLRKILAIFLFVLATRWSLEC